MSKVSSKNSRKRSAPNVAAPATATASPCITINGEPTDYDVVMGQGSAQSWRPGNMRFHQLLDQMHPLYKAASRKKQKRAIIQQIYDTITSRGRFVENTSGDNGYVELDEDNAKKRTGDAMRYRKKRFRKVREAFINEKCAVERAEKEAPAETRMQRNKTELCATPQPATNTNNNNSGIIELFSDEELQSVLLGDGDLMQYEQTNQE